MTPGDEKRKNATTARVAKKHENKKKSRRPAGRPADRPTHNTHHLAVLLHSRLVLLHKVRVGVHLLVAPWAHRYRRRREGGRGGARWVRRGYLPNQRTDKQRLVKARQGKVQHDVSRKTRKPAYSYFGGTDKNAPNARDATRDDYLRRFCLNYPPVPEESSTRTNCCRLSFRITTPHRIASNRIIVGLATTRHDKTRGERAPLNYVQHLCCSCSRRIDPPSHGLVYMVLNLLFSINITTQLFITSLSFSLSHTCTSGPIEASARSAPSYSLPRHGQFSRLWALDPPPFRLLRPVFPFILLVSNVA